MFKNCKISNFQLSILLFALVIFALPLANKSHAQTDGCDNDILETMKQKAWMEMQREKEVNNQYIWRPDSVLQYTCFNNLAAIMLDSADGFFTNEGTRSNAPRKTSDDFAASIVGMVNTEYLADQLFDATYQNPATGDNPNQTAGDGNTSYSCNEMQTIWAAAKCIDTDAGDILTLQDIHAGVATTRYTESGPSDLTCTANLPTSDADAIQWNNNYIRTTDLNSMNATTDYFDEIIGQFDLWLAYNEINPTSTTAITQCADPIPTGVIITTSGSNGQEYFDGICPNSGCSLIVATGSGKKAVKCCPNTTSDFGNAACSVKAMNGPTGTNPTPY